MAPVTGAREFGLGQPRAEPAAPQPAKGRSQGNLLLRVDRDRGRPGGAGVGRTDHRRGVGRALAAFRAHNGALPARRHRLVQRPLRNGKRSRRRRRVIELRTSCLRFGCRGVSPRRPPHHRPTAAGYYPAPVTRKQASTVGLPPKLMLMGGNELSPESGSAAADIGVSGSGRLAWVMPR